MVTDPLQSSKGQLGVAVEDTKYTKKDPIGLSEHHLGIIRDEVNTPNPNPHEPMTTGGFNRKPYILSPEQKEYEYDIPILVVDGNIPLEIAFGNRTETDKTDYKEIMFTESDLLPTATIMKYQADAGDYGVVDYYIGTKADLSVDVSEGDPLELTLTCYSTKMDHNELTETDTTPELTTPQKDPYRFSHKGDVTFYQEGTTTVDTTLATVNSLSADLNNGIEPNFHGNGREAYTLSQSTAEDKYDVTLGITIHDLEMFKKAYDNEEPVDVEVPFHKDNVVSDSVEAIIFKFNHSKIVDSPIPKGGEGSLETDIEIQPREITVEIREPLS